MPALLDDGSRPDAYRHGDLELDRVYLGDEQVWPPLPLVPMGMDFTGTASVSSGQTVDVTGFVPRSGFPDTVIDAGTALVIGGPGTIRVHAGASPANAYLRWRVMHYTAGAWVEQVNVSNGVTGESGDFAVDTGDLLKMTISSTFSTRSISSAYVYFDVISSGQ